MIVAGRKCCHDEFFSVLKLVLGTEKMLLVLCAEKTFRQFIRNSFILAMNTPPSHVNRHIFINYFNALRKASYYKFKEQAKALLVWFV
ncbi:MAG TPA: hypothetical protein P5227_13530, partial [Emcibacteraceae bacterium]|nr:hypothetical protein [Emcibacteraceae bacterium]